MKSQNPFNPQKAYVVSVVALDEFNIEQFIGGQKHSETTANRYNTSEITFIDQMDLKALEREYCFKQIKNAITDIESREKKIEAAQELESNWECINYRTQAMGLKVYVKTRIDAHRAKIRQSLACIESLKPDDELIQEVCKKVGVWWECYAVEA